ncbi:hypothetical protein H4219_005010 [Mycoemilia scoparia]|uniref:Signal peptidase complex subunit 1 n=1 Tax=Mycoemilia scoparia TaxID=417184 RepID=A0A9W7ZW98_9FUNG|nr:hypothetical protein H4219_005010 [Mycoemilia scoparia]
MDQLTKLLEKGQIDLKGQQLAEKIYTFTLFISGALSILVSIYFNEIMYSFYGLGIGLAVSWVLVIPPWPCFNKNPLNWLPVQSVGAAATSASASASKKSQVPEEEDDDDEKAAGGVKQTTVEDVDDDN